MRRTEGSNYELIAGLKYFTNGPPGTTVEQNWLNAMQEEVCGVIEEAGIVVETAAAETRDQLKAAIAALIATGVDAKIPSGTVFPYTSDVVPTGYLECDGANVNRTTYADLFSVIAENYGEGDGATTFSLPDYRGKFIRGYDNGAGNDPDAATRTAQSAGGKTGDDVGSVQMDAFQRVTGSVIAGSDAVNLGVFRSASGGLVESSTVTSNFTSGARSAERTMSLALGNSVTPNAAKQSEYESRAINANAMYIIKT